jgi:quercetin dioxygenase-like cupin family protein
MIRTTGVFLFALLGILPMPLAAQTGPIIEVEAEPHHHLALKNGAVKVYVVSLASHDAFLMHRHDHDDLVIVMGEATTVSASPGQADTLRISKPGEVRLSPRNLVHSVRNIGQSPYSFTGVELLQNQTGARNLCGKQVPDSPPDCPAAPLADANAPRVDVPQFETDQTRVVLARIRPHKHSTFGEAGRDELLVPLGGAQISALARKGPDRTLQPGECAWLARGKAKRTITNNNDTELSIVLVSLKP